MQIPTAPRRRRGRRRIPLTLLFFLLIVLLSVLMLVLLACMDEILKNFGLSRRFLQFQYDARTKSSCTPRAIRSLDIRFYATPREKHTNRTQFHVKLWQKARESIEKFGTMRFAGQHMQLCGQSSTDGDFLEWQDCLPIHTVIDEPKCVDASHSSRNVLLQAMDYEDPRRVDGGMENQAVCRKNVLQMILEDVYEALQELDTKPALVFGSLLGALRNQSVIEYTEDVDVGYVDRFAKRSFMMEGGNPAVQMLRKPHQLEAIRRQPMLAKLRHLLYSRGYHVFHQSLIRVCIAPHHPLARFVYDPTRPLVDLYQVPYADLYEMSEQAHGQEWSVSQMRGGRRIPVSSFLPYSTLRVGDREFDVPADPKFFLEQEYGDDFMTPWRSEAE